MSVALLFAGVLMAQTPTADVAEGPVNCVRDDAVHQQMDDAQFEVLCFVNWVYGPGVLESITPLGRDGPRVFTRAALDEMAAARGRSTDGQSHPAFEADPLCGCQDPAGLRLASSMAPEVGPDRALVWVMFDFGAGTDEPSSLNNIEERTLILRREAEGWRIDDITTGDGWSFRRSLAD